MNIIKSKLWVTLITTIILLISNVKIGIAIQENNKESDSLEYIYAFTEATKQALFGNYKHAIALYNKCLEKNENRSAVYFQLSNIYMKLEKNDLALYYAKNAVDNAKAFNKWYLLHLANMYQKNSEYDSAEKVYRTLYNNLEDNIEIAYGLAKLNGIIGNYEEALEIWEKIEKIVGINEEIKLEKHDLYNKLNLTDEAEKELLILIENFYYEIKYYGILAEYYIEKGLMEKAKQQYDSIFSMDSLNILALLSYREFALKTNKKEESIRCYKKIIQHKDIDENLKFELCLDLIKRNDFKEYNNDIFEMITFLNIIKNDNTSKSLIAEFYIKNNEFLKAISIIDEMIMNDKENIKLWEQAIILEYVIERKDSLIKKIEEALKINDKESKFYYYKGLAEINGKNYEEVVNTLKIGLKYVNDSTLKENYYSLLGECYFYLNDFEKSDYYFDRVLEKNPENLIVRNNYSYYMALRNVNLKKALTLSRYTIEKEPLNGTFLDTYGWILFIMGKTKKAEFYIEEALKNGENDNPEVISHYAEIMLKKGNYDEAIIILQKALEIDNENIEIKNKLEYIMKNQ